jgi:Ca2+-binding RTX toxin-like protein
VTFSNANFNWQLGVLRNMGIKTPKLQGPGFLAEPFYALANPYIGQLTKVPEGGGTSFAIGGATAGTSNLFELLTPEAASAYRITNTGIANQIQQAISVDPILKRNKVKQNSRTLVTLWGGSNDLLVANESENSLAGTLESILGTLRSDLIALVRNGGARQVLAGALAPLQGVVDGKPYQMPFLSGLIAAAETAPEGSYLKEWLRVISDGGIQQFQIAFLEMVSEVQAMYPYANLMGFIPEYEAFSRKFGEKYGTFKDYGIENTLGYAQASGTTPAAEGNRFLYFDPAHATESGQVMLERGIELTLLSEQDAIKSSTLNKVKKGDKRDNIMIGGKTNDGFKGRKGNDLLRGKKGWDDLRGDDGRDQIEGGKGRDLIMGGKGSDTMRGGGGADFFLFTSKDANGDDRDVIVDFKGKKGDRLGISTVNSATGLFGESGWTYIGSASFTGQTGELRFSNETLKGDINGDGIADLKIRLEGVSVFQQNWIS